MKIGFRLASVLLVLSLFGSTRAQAESVTFYKIDEAPGLLAGVIMRGGQMFAVFGHATDKDSAENTFNKMVPLKKGKKSCTEMRNIEVGVTENSTPCITLKKLADGLYSLDAVIKYQFPGFDMRDADALDVLKGYDYVKERRFLMTVSFDKSGCSANVTQRSYLALDGNKPVPARTGELKCTIRGR